MKRGYYAILPANVRYDKKLTPNAKLLYAEITALCNKEGYCWATNEYFADLYSMSKSSISRNISSLVEGQYLNISFTENRTKRKLSLRVRKNDKGGTQKQVGGYAKMSTIIIKLIIKVIYTLSKSFIMTMERRYLGLLLRKHLRNLL